ncbi:hypothetical protein [Limnobacter sp. P1]|uniref:hypothetical protein n=1 Tax=Limnobacter olei TaxID=3031298 RepID=UPI0023B13109|nr:hypothetical protein [Limnobacter sp. P1]
MASVLNTPLVDNEICYRCVHPQYYSQAGLSDKAFLPTSADLGFLSVERSAGNTAKDSYDRRIAMGKKVAAVMGVTVGEFGSQLVPVSLDPVYGDDKTEVINQWHCLADFNKVKDPNIVAKALKKIALTRTPEYLP